MPNHPVNSPETANNANGIGPQASVTMNIAYGIQMENFGLILPQNKVSKVVDDYQLCPLPSSVEWFLGMANIESSAIPVFDLNLYLLNKKNDPNTKPHLIIIGSESESVAFTFNKQPIQVDLGRAIKTSELPSLPEKLNGMVDLCYQLDVHWLSWDFKKFFLFAGSHI